MSEFLVFAAGFAMSALIQLPLARALRRRRRAGADQRALRDLQAEVAAHESEERARRRELLELRRAHHDLEQGEIFQRAVFEASAAGLLVVDPRTGQVMDANAAAAAILARPVDDLVGTCAAADLGLDGEDLLDPGRFDAPPAEARMRRADGAELTVIRSIRLITGDSGDLAVVGFVDISARRRAEADLQSSHEALARAHEDLERHKDQIVQSEKLASIGQLAAGVAHEINNPIGYVTSNLGTMQEYFASLTAVLRLYEERDALAAGDAPGHDRLTRAIADARADEDLDFILGDLGNVLAESREGVDRVTDIVQNLKSFAREDSGERAPYDVNETVMAMIRMAWNELKYRCEVTTELGEVPTLVGHAGQISQVLMNILVNAAQAIPGAGGRVTVTTACADGEVLVSVADTGTGIPPEVLPRIFDPFFTTKEVGQGTGLGLAISHGIIQDHGGRIAVASAPGRGTTFTLHLPVAARPVAATTP